MKKHMVFILCLLVASTAAVVCGGRSEDPYGVAVSPQNLILGSDQGGSVVVHTDGVPYSSVDKSTVSLQGVPATSTKADLCGDLVAYFDEGAIKAIVKVPSATLTLTWANTDGKTFSGSDTVKVSKAK